MMLVIPIEAPARGPAAVQGSSEAKSRAPIASKAVQTLVEAETRTEKQAAGAAEKAADIKGKIFACIWYMESKATPRKQYAQQTARYAFFNSEALTYWTPTQSKRSL
jgi:hypothetical protein